MYKTNTDMFWDARAINERNLKAVNIADIAQRSLETDFLLKNLSKNDSILEVGCGNGFLTSTLRQHVAHIDAFDYSENMINSAIQNFGESNNHFFHDNLLQPTKLSKQYDAIVCVRVLINLSNLQEQIQALDNLKKHIKPGGKILLVEGYIDGFNEINALRKAVSLPELKPAAINFYSHFNEIQNHLAHDYEIADQFHTGCFDFLTRIVYPSLVGHENAQGYSDFHDKVLTVAKHYNPNDLLGLARVRGLCLVKR